MRTVDDLVTWLRAQLDDDERVANRVEPNQAPTDLRAMVTRDDDTPFLIIDSARVLSEVDAKRRILDFLEYDRIDVSTAGGPPETVPGARPVIAHPVLRLLALPYADRPGYRDDWRPA
jgi:hypothetical protein